MTLNNKIPPPVVTLIFGLAMWLFARFTPRIEVPSGLSVTMAIVLLVLGILSCGLGVYEFRRARTTVNPLKPETASALVSRGVYQYTRNPMYLGFLLFLIAWAVYLASPVTLLGALGFVFYMNQFQIQPEERVLQRIFGDEYKNYKARVRRWL